MKNYQFSWKLFSILLVVVIVFTLGLVLYAESQQTVACLSSSCGPTQSGENIGFYSYHVNSPTNVTITLVNTGSLTSALAEYFIKDSSGNAYSNTTLAGPPLSPGATASVNILLSGNPSGQPFQIQSSHAYSVIIVTARNNPFTYTFTT